MSSITRKRKHSGSTSSAIDTTGRTGSSKRQAIGADSDFNGMQHKANDMSIEISGLRKSNTASDNHEPGQKSKSVGGEEESERASDEEDSEVAEYVESGDDKEDEDEEFLASDNLTQDDELVIDGQEMVSANKTLAKDQQGNSNEAGSDEEQSAASTESSEDEDEIIRFMPNQLPWSINWPVTKQVPTTNNRYGAHEQGNEHNADATKEEGQQYLMEDEEMPHHAVGEDDARGNLTIAQRNIQAGGPHDRDTATRHIAKT